MKNEFKVIADLIEKDKRVLDVGCADGTLMKFLKDNKNINIRGLEISSEFHQRNQHLKLFCLFQLNQQLL